MFAQFLLSTDFFFQNAVWSTESKVKPVGIATAVAAVTLSGGWIYFWESGTWKLSVGKSQLIMDHFSAAVYQGDAAAEGFWQALPMI